MQEKRNRVLDLMKALAIIAVVLYHSGFLTYGYLGVDIFLVIDGYLITRKLLLQIEEGTFRYFSFLIGRIVRLWPLVILCSAVSLLLGIGFMMPDDLENLSASIVASNMFALNILARIVSKDYWDVSLLYKPLMHFWYLGIVVQFYAVYPWILKGSVWIKNRLNRKMSARSAMLTGIMLMSAVSLILYVIPSFNSYDKFYFLQFRLFEFGVGGVCCTESFAMDCRRVRRFAVVGGVCALLALVAFPYGIGNMQFRLVLITAISGLLILISRPLAEMEERHIGVLDRLALLGRCSYSIFVWHQMILAFYRYIVNADMQAADYIICFALLCLLVTPSYLGVEQKAGGYLRTKGMRSFVGLCGMGATICIGGFALYLRAGVIRDVPELGVEAANVTRGIWSAYNSRVYDMDVPFAEDDRLKILALGNSYARDWVNILLESEYSDWLDITYIYEPADTSEYDLRYEEADLIFLSNEGDMRDFVRNYMKEGAEVYLIGIKRFGNCNGNIYSKRSTADYLLSMTKVPDDIWAQYQSEKERWQDQYIDMIEPVSVSEGYVRVFTPDGKFISQDCRHLTQYGAQYYAELLDLGTLLDKKITVR